MNLDSHIAQKYERTIKDWNIFKGIFKLSFLKLYV